jgi:hypothetical protein
MIGRIIVTIELDFQKLLQVMKGVEWDFANVTTADPGGDRRRS